MLCSHQKSKSHGFSQYFGQNFPPSTQCYKCTVFYVSTTLDCKGGWGLIMQYVEEDLNWICSCQLKTSISLPWEVTFGASYEGEWERELNGHMSVGVVAFLATPTLIWATWSTFPTGRYLLTPASRCHKAPQWGCQYLSRKIQAILFIHVSQVGALWG